jgi:hypothetical protein
MFRPTRLLLSIFCFILILFFKHKGMSCTKFIIASQAYYEIVLTYGMYILFHFNNIFETQRYVLYQDYYC